MNQLIIENFKDIKKNIELINKNYSFDKKVKIIAVTKGHHSSKIECILKYGHKVFGENKLQEAKEKWVVLKEKYPDIRLHMIGNIQSNKLNAACKIFDTLQTVDRKSLIDKLSKIKQDKGNIPEIFIQVNIGNEPQKSGCKPENLKHLIEYSLSKGIFPRGLMCIPPKDKLSVFYFTTLKNLATEYGIKETSMGMSNDYDKAIICNSDYIRVGTRIFGSR